MKVIYLEGIRKTIFEAISKANRQNKPIDRIVLTREEDEELQSFHKGHGRINVFDGVPIVVVKSPIIIPERH